MRTKPAATESEAWEPLDRPLARILGPRTAVAFEKLGLHNVGDLLFHIPFRLAQRGELMPIRNVVEGESVTVVAKVLHSSVRPMNSRRGHILNVEVSDGERNLALTFFAKNPWPLHFHASKLQPGVTATFSGTIRSYRGGLQLSHPEYEVLENLADLDPSRIAEPIPIYHATQGLPSWKIEKAVSVVLAGISADDLPDPLPPAYLRQHGLLSKFDAITAAHRPHTVDEWQQARLRLKHEEAFVLQALLAKRASAAQLHPAPELAVRDDAVRAAFDAQLPFVLTDSQRAVGAQLEEELARPTPMRRLLQGDVGSGKTIVALRAMLQAVDAGYQAVMVAPTEVLASQHAQTFASLLGELGKADQLNMLRPGQAATWVELLTGSLSAPERRRTLAKLASGEPGIAVGTHALFQESVQLPRLGLVVVDEQHRFGVDQRNTLAEGAHLLVMTATPIPRTIAMTSFGELETSVLAELPQGRQPIATTLVPAYKRAWVDRIWHRAQEEIRAGGRVYVVAPRIDNDDAPTAPGPAEPSPAGEGGGQSLVGEQGRLDESGAPPATVMGTYQQLQNEPALAGIEIGYVHGRLDAEQKARAMAAFADGSKPLLVTTTVIEVGVDVPEATMMVILDAERFGLSQLHQLRGRVGRGSKPSICLAVHNAPDGSIAMERLEAFAETTNGFKLAQRDLELRAEGDVLGTSQSGGASTLKFLRVAKDARIIEQARASAREIVNADPTLAGYPQLLAALAQLDGEDTEYLERS